MICVHCYSDLLAPDEMGCCPYCGSNPTLVPEPQRTWDANAKTLGFEDAQRLHEAPSWSKAGDVLRKP